MIISRTPFRISFFGGGTDYPVWYREQPGAVLATTINKFCYITCRYLPPFFEHKSRIVWSMIERVNRAEEIQHPAVRAGLEFVGIRQGVELHHDGDLPARTGLGSSSSFTVGLLHTLYGLKGQRVSKRQLARDAIYLEQELLKEAVGSQDQVMAAYGGLNRVDFDSDGEIRVCPIPLPTERRKALEAHLMLFFTGISRTASEIAKTQIAATQSNQARLRVMYQQVDRAIEILQGSGDLAAFGELLHEGWLLKRSLTDRISTSAIDDCYERARASGAFGGKLLGAGGGGFLLLFARPEEQGRVSEALRGLLQVPVQFESAGSQIIFYDPDGLSATAEEQAPASQPAAV